MGVRAAILLVKGAQNSYRRALFVLAAGIAIGVVHMLASRALRGSSMPVDAVTYTTVLTLIVFLILRIPAIWQAVDFAKGHPRANQSAVGAAAIVIGLLALTVQFLMGSTHTWDGVNYADAFHVSMTIIGFLFLLVGAGLVIRRDTRKTNPSLERGFSGF